MADRDHARRARRELLRSFFILRVVAENVSHATARLSTADHARALDAAPGHDGVDVNACARERRARRAGRHPGAALTLDDIRSRLTGPAEAASCCGCASTTAIAT
jgi:hypothetical protein